MWRKLRKWMSLSRTWKRLLIEAWLLLGWARLLKLIPFAKVAPYLGEQMTETSHAGTKENEMTVLQISNAILLMSRHTPWESQCLVKAMAAMKMLSRRGIESTLYLGTARDESGKMIAHAWLRSGPMYVTGAETMERFTVVAMFGKTIRNMREAHEYQA